ncbi:transketolase [Maridesulfovibrio hydrothermalis]|uniref:Transketolase n=1 Tax=Maridesulfovibrio hydrothermalis AM13 = DSM 14728 TaxID=1121451 RepID=L0RG85_9BACT|nr:transketolase [Maridesulfovibrio hydrothermalis]CCO25225.1 transketolase 1, thiamin-binding [Maridesulfovibrio hydrothermalis AM13 = DSM 14728]
MSDRKELANAIRALSMDAIQKAESGHPGAPLGMADIAEVLWNDYLVHNPANPEWPDRDRFVLSNGHGSMLLYSLLHLSGYEVTIDDIKQFRQLHSKTPGHPEYGMTPGVESTSGPLGQGIACAVGMAVAEKVLAARYNREGHTIMDHYTYVFMGDGCMMEGISHEACSLAGTLKLGKLVAFYDDNGISIDGCVDGWFTDDTPGRFESYGWHVVSDVDGHDAKAIKAAIEEARAETGKPSMICCKTVIGQGAPNVCGSEKCHGSPLGENEISCARENMNWPYAAFEVPESVYSAWTAVDSGSTAESSWKRDFAEYEKAYPQLAAEFTRRMKGDLPDGFATYASNFINSVDAKAENLATRKASQNAIEGLAPVLPEFYGGSADLAGSNLTRWSGSETISPANWDGNYMNYGVREFAMSVMMNGMSLHGGFIPYGGTFLVFSDYARNAMRMSALMGLKVLYVMTHDSIGVGEDGPTHQPVEHVASLRLIPGMDVWRPCDAVEAAVSWEQAVMRDDGPSTLVKSRQNLPHQNRSAQTLAQVSRGGYVLRQCDGTPDIILIATGSEVSLAMEAAITLESKGKQVRVVSMPCVEVFERQDKAYQNEVLPSHVAARIAVEAGVTASWYRYVGLQGAVMGLDRFGESAPGSELFDYFDFTADSVVRLAEQVMDEKSKTAG